jgi:hypothetical protein
MSRSTRLSHLSRRVRSAERWKGVRPPSTPAAPAARAAPVMHAPSDADGSPDLDGSPRPSRTSAASSATAAGAAPCDDSSAGPRPSVRVMAQRLQSERDSASVDNVGLRNWRSASNGSASPQKQQITSALRRLPLRRGCDDTADEISPSVWQVSAAAEALLPPAVAVRGRRAGSSARSSPLSWVVRRRFGAGSTSSISGGRATSSANVSFVWWRVVPGARWNQASPSSLSLPPS